jgi:hypothetical protein
MKLTGPACTEAMSGAEEAGRRERAEGKAGGVRVERRVRPSPKQKPPEPAVPWDLSLLEWECGTMQPTQREEPGVIAHNGRDGTMVDDDSALAEVGAEKLKLDGQ